MTTSDDSVSSLDARRTGSGKGSRASSAAPAGTAAAPTLPPATLGSYARLSAWFDTNYGSSVPPMNLVVTRATHDYLGSIDTTAPPQPQDVEAHLLALVNKLIQNLNGATSTATEKLTPMRRLTAWQTAQALLKMRHIIRIAPSAKDTDREYDLLGMYVEHGPGRGTHTVSEDDIRTAARAFDTSMTTKDFIEVMAVLKEDAPRTHRNTHRDLIAVDDGIFNYSNNPVDLVVRGRSLHFEPKSLHDFDPAVVFLSKIHVPYVVDAPNPVLTDHDGDDWDVHSWIEDLSDDEGVPELLWEIIGAMVRPHVRWNKTAWFYSEQGNNGKGTLCALMRNLVGPQAYTSIPLSDFGKEFALEPLVRASAIIVDENDVGTFVDRAANLKAVVTNDVIQINRKYRMPIAYQFFGFMVQCLNEFPQVKDKSESFYRRQLFVPFSKTFTGREKRWIKDDYLQRPEVLEHVLWYVLHQAGASSPGEYYELSEPEVTKDVLAEYKETNDPVRAFWGEHREEFAWRLLPFGWLYSAYKAWFGQVNPSGSPVSNRKFISNIVEIVRSDPDWYCPDKNKKIRPGSMMDDPEPLSARYDLTDWMDPHYSGSDPMRRCKPVLAASYRGLLRHDKPAANGSADPQDIPPSTLRVAPQTDQDTPMP